MPPKPVTVGGARPRKKNGNESVEGLHCEPIAIFRNLLPRSGLKAKCASCSVWILVAFLGLFAFSHMGAYIAETDLPARVSKVATAVSYFLGKHLRSQLHISNPNYTYTGIFPPYVMNSSECGASKQVGLGLESVLPPASQRKPGKGPEIPFCLAVSIGDDGDRPNNEALPYPLIYRLFDALKEEIEAEAGTGDQAYTGGVQILTGVDYPSVMCKMVRDFVNDTFPHMTQHCVSFRKLTSGIRCRKVISGTSKRFVPQISSRWTRAVESETHRFVDLDCPDPSHQPPHIPEEEWQPTIVTGFSSNHLAVGLLMLRSVGKAVKEGGSALSNVSIVVWAMEVFKPEHQQLLGCVMDELNDEYGVKAEVRLFNFSEHPQWMQLHQELHYLGGTGEYAWKAIMVHTILRERGMVLWADAGDRFHDTASLVETLKTLKSTGFVSRKSHGTVWTRTHPLHLKYYRANLPAIWDLQNCEAAIVGFSLKKYTEVARPWYDCSITRQCIAPDGSDRTNHRQDQSALTLISIITKNRCEGGHPHFAHHMDDDPTLSDISGAYLTKCYFDPLVTDW